jgi:hypothetical protein
MGDGTGVGDDDYWKLDIIEKPLNNFGNISIKQHLSKPMRYDHTSLVPKSRDVNIQIYYEEQSKNEESLSLDYEK